MARYCGQIGYVDMVKTAPGVLTEEVTERTYFGDVNRNARRLESADQLNDNINVTNELSIVADPYAMNHFHSIRYAEFMGAKWKVSNVTVQPPRLILTLGGLYTNGQ